MVQSVTRVLDILEALATSDEELSIAELQATLNLPAPTVHRLLKSLVDRGYAEKNPTSRQYGPGFRLLLVAEAAKGNRRFSLLHTARPFLQQLTDGSGETSNLTVLQADELVYVGQVASSQRMRMFTEVGHRAPLYCTGAGKAILSRLPRRDLERYLATTRLRALTPHTIRTVVSLTDHLDRIRQQGFAIDDEEYELGIRSVAAPIFDATGSCLGAISISGPTSRLGSDRALVLGPRVRQVSIAMSNHLGYHDPDHTWEDHPDLFPADGA